MKTEKIAGSLMAAALGLSTVMPVGLNTNAVSVSETNMNNHVSYADKSYSLGDVNGDGEISSADASCVIAEYSNLSTTGQYTFTEIQIAAADIDKNNIIDANDASEILAYYSYLSTGGTIKDMQEYINFMHSSQQTTTTTSTTTTTTTTTTTADSTSATAKTTTATAVTSTEKTISSGSSETTTSTATENTTSSATKPDTTTTTTSSAADKTTTTTAVSTSSETTTTTTTTTTSSSSITTATTTVTETETTTSTTTNADNVSGIRIDQTEISLDVGKGKLAANVTMLPLTALNKSEIWTSSDENIAVVDNEGWVIGKGEGTCIITVTSADNPEVSADITVNVTDTSLVKDIRLSRTSFMLKAGYGELSANVTMLPDTAVKSEIWTSSDESIAVVDSEGWVFGKSAGTCIITVKSAVNPSVYADIEVIVYDNEPPVTTTATVTTSTTTSSDETTTTTTTTAQDRVKEIKLSKYEMTIETGSKDISWVTMLPSTASNKKEIWRSSDENIASVDEFGWVRGKNTGECTITVYSDDNPDVKAEIAVKVVEKSEEPKPNPWESALFTCLADGESTDTHVALYTPFPKNASGKYVVDYIITDKNGKVTTLSSDIISVPDKNSVTMLLASETPNFTVKSYLTNLCTNQRTYIGTYELCTSPRYAKTLSEDIYSAFESVGGITEE